MKSDMEILREMILSDALTYPLPMGKHHKLVLKEIGEHGQPSYSATLYHIPENTLAVKADKFPTPSNFYKSSNGVTQRADFIVIIESKKIILFIELKYRKKGNGMRGLKGTITKQLKGSTCVLAHCKEVANQYFSGPNFLAGYQYKYIAMFIPSIDKQPLKPKQKIHISQKDHNYPDSVLKIMTGMVLLEFP